MKNTFGNLLCVTLFGESHGSEIGAVLDGIAPGIPVDEGFIRSQLELRRPFGGISTARVEQDEFRIVSGVFNGYTTGAPICIIIPNSDVNSAPYGEKMNIPRPGHADYTADVKYHGYEDFRGGGHFSGRLTAPLTAVGAIVISALREKGIEIGTHILSIGNIYDIGFSSDRLHDEIVELNKVKFAVLDRDLGEKMKKEILKAGVEGDSVGGVLETAVLGVPAGVGEPWFDCIESKISQILFSIPAVKGVEFGDGFAMTHMKGSLANDGFESLNGRIVTATNHNGGINGGISNGMPIICRCAVKPTPSISVEQRSVDLSSGKNAMLTLNGRHDPAIVHRARVVVDSAVAIALADLLCEKYGTDWLMPGKK